MKIIFLNFIKYIYIYIYIYIIFHHKIYRYRYSYCVFIFLSNFIVFKIMILLIYIFYILWLKKRLKFPDTTLVLSRRSELWHFDQRIFILRSCRLFVEHRITDTHYVSHGFGVWIQSLPVYKTGGSTKWGKKRWIHAFPKWIIIKWNHKQPCPRLEPGLLSPLFYNSEHYTSKFFFWLLLV